MAIQKGTGFTNLNRIMQANKGNKLGQTVSGGITGQVEGVKSGVKSAQEQFQEEAQKNRLDTQESADKRSSILNRFAPSTGTSGSSNTVQPNTPTVGLAQEKTGTPNLAKTSAAPQQTAAGNATPIVSDQEISDFTKYRTGTYTGPKELQDASTLYGKAQQAESLGGLARSEGGRQELLRRFVGGDNYTQGQRTLDSSILGQQPGSLGAASRETRGASNIVDKANTQASNLAQEYTNRAKDFGAQTMTQIGEKKTPISQGVDTRVTQAQTDEQNRKTQLKSMQDLLEGSDPAYKGLDQWTRSGLALQDAANRGMLTQDDVDMLMGTDGKIGLLQRGGNLGLDMSKLLKERLTDAQAQNMSRTGVAGDDDIAKLNALDRLAGKQGTDLEFLEGRGKYQAGKTGFNTSSLLDYISKTEGERAASDKAYADKLAAEQARYLNQAKAGVGQAMGGAMQTAGGGLGAVIDPMGNLTGANQEAIVGGVGNMGLGQARAYSQGSNAILEGLTKLNVGGQSLANTEGGRQLLKAIELKSKLENEALGIGQQGLGTATGMISDLGKGKVLDAYKAPYDLAANVGSQLASNYRDEAMKAAEKVGLGNVASGVSNAASSAVQTAGNVIKNPGSVASSVGNAVKSIASGGGIKISDEELKENIQYSPKDVQGFMDRIKPAAYDYKDEVKNSPLASKNRELGVMAQDLEKSKLGKESVTDTSAGKVVDYDNLGPKMLASIASLNERLKNIEKK